MAVNRRFVWQCIALALIFFPAITLIKKNVWADLNAREVSDLLQFLYNKPNVLNLTKVEHATAAVVESLPPNKTVAINYLEDDSEEPPRWARVVVNQGVKEQATIEEYMVGPLPPGPNTVIEPLSYLYNSGRNDIRNPLPDYDGIVRWFIHLGGEIPEIVEDLLGPVMNPSNLTWAPPLMALSRPATFRAHGVSSWASIHATGIRFDAWSLQPQGLYCRFNITGRDSKNWQINEWFYNGIIYNSTESFISAVKSPGFQKVPLNIDGDWSAAEPTEKGLPGRDEEQPPVMIQPYGPRFKIDEKEKFVSWMGYEFYITTLQATGLSLWDIRFRGERIIYELGLQEAMAHYAGGDPMSSAQVWLDSLFGMGTDMLQLIPGYDCPPYATYLTTTFQSGDSVIWRSNSICVFEYVSDAPLQRHSTDHQITASKNTYLVVRSVSTVGNYDYTFDYIFYLDGSIEVKVRASGYIFGAYHQPHSTRPSDTSDYSPEEYPEYHYGYQIHDVLAASMHDHVLNFKADLDIAGSRNTLYSVNIEPLTTTYPWDTNPDHPDTPHSRNTMHLTHTPVTIETGLDWPPNSGKMYVMLNNESTNTWGEKRGYRITPGTGMGTPAHLTIKNSTSLLRAAEWSAHDLWILRRRDSERKSTSEYNGMEPGDPLVRFGDMVDDESIAQEDLVVYFNLGNHHVPHSGDIPNTLMHTSASSVMFVPHNYFDRDVSREAAHGIRVDTGRNNGGKGDVATWV
ncbi:amine oxidase catalytic domain-containing protein [Saccharata proteae CBS 121410]|uniref:Amine oxidase n=1 Tax=Saccharata proteae CBS 121410 TaxID=1314787 RepID=A0A9P4HZZ0_9PEZI|nr:amine oxidase catalytic domain-containing protein [Saccharata proteae CBS 121410]